MYQFGSGSLFGVPVGGNENTNPTPMKFGTLQDVSLDISGTLKELYGQKQFPDIVARGKMKISGKAKFAKINGKQLNDIYFGQTTATGTVHAVIDEVHTVAVGSATASGTPITDLGVIYQATGIPLVKVASAPTVGQYSQSGATYTFNTTDNTQVVLISYTATSTGGVTLNINNQLLGFAPVIQILMNDSFNNQQMSVLAYQAIASKLSIATKQEDFIIPEFDFECFANAGGQVFSMYSDE